MWKAYRKKLKANEFIDEKQKMKWLEMAVSELETILIQAPPTSREYIAAVRDHDHLIMEQLIIKGVTPKRYPSYV